MVHVVTSTTIGDVHIDYNDHLDSRQSTYKN